MTSLEVAALATPDATSPCPSLASLASAFLFSSLRDSQKRLPLLEGSCASSSLRAACLAVGLPAHLPSYPGLLLPQS